jgi:hypothetical protein
MASLLIGDLAARSNVAAPQAMRAPLLTVTAILISTLSFVTTPASGQT